MTGERVSRTSGQCFAGGAVLLLGGIAWIVGCSVSIDPGGDDNPTVSFTVANKTITLEFGDAGVFNLRPGETITKIIDMIPFERPPDDAPVSAVLRIVPESVIVRSETTSSKSGVNAAGPGEADGVRWTGSLDLEVWIAKRGQMNQCEDGTYIGSWFLAVENDVVTGVGSGHVGPLGGWIHSGNLQLFLDNGFSLCLKTNATTSTEVSNPEAFTGTVTFQGVELTFGPNNEVTYVDDPEGRPAPGTTEACCWPPLIAYFDHKEPRQQFCEDLASSERFGAPRHQCERAGGVWKGAGSSCAGATCNEEFRVCCMTMNDPNDSHPCAEFPEEFCVSGEIGIVGTVFPPGLTCEQTPSSCGEEAQACCLPDGSCRNVPLSRATECSAVNGVLQAVATRCGRITCPSPPPQPSTQACCLTNVSCRDVAADTCATIGGTPQGSGTRCSGLTCPAYGGCCALDATCTLRTRDACRALSATTYALYLGDSTSCNPNRCEQPTGACCDRNGNCDYVEEQTCTNQGGRYVGHAASCQPNPCQAVKGACCDDLGGCTPESEFQCNNLHRAYLGDGASCDPNQCPPPLGACCHGNPPICTMTSSEGCVELAGRYDGDAVACGAVACPTPPPPPEIVVWYTANVCCWGAPHVRMTTREEFEEPKSTADFGYGGIDYSNPAIKKEIQGGFASYADAQAWICPQFTSWSYHYWCGAHHQMGGKNWLPSLGCDFTNLPRTDTPPTVDGCAP